MAGKLSPAAQVRLAELGGLLEKVHRIHHLVEQYAAARDGGEQYILPVSRAFNALKLYMSGAGFDAMAQLAGSMELAARRGLSRTARIRVLRDGVGSLKFQLELAQRTVVNEARVAEQKKEGGADGTRTADGTPGPGPSGP